MFCFCAYKRNFWIFGGQEKYIGEKEGGLASRHTLMIVWIIFSCMMESWKRDLDGGVLVLAP